MDHTICCFLNQYRETYLYMPNEPQLQQKAEIQDEILRLFWKNGARHFLSSMELGFPTLAAQAVLKLKKDYPLTLECVLPYEEQASDWKESERDLYFSILERCDKETMLQTLYTPDCLQNCHRYLLAHSNLVLTSHYCLEKGGLCNRNVKKMPYGAGFLN